MPKVIKSQLVEIIQPGGSTATRLQLPDQPYLRNKRITGIEIVTVADMSVSPTGKTPISGTDLKKSFLTLYLNDPGKPEDVGEWIQSVPGALLHRVQNSSNDPFVRQMYELDSQVVYWEKCYFTFGSALGNVADVSFLINVYFKG